MTDELYSILNRPSAIAWQIKKLESELAGLQETARPCAIRYDKDRVQGSGDDTLNKYMEKADRLEQRINSLLQQYSEAVDDVVALANRLPDPQSAIVISRFVERLRFHEIADRIHMSERHMFRHYHEAIEKLEKAPKVVSACQ